MSNVSLNFGGGSNFNSNNVPMLKPWGIYDVKFDGAEYSTFAGKTDPSITYEVLKFNFSNEDGKYTETFFAPKPGDEVRMKRKNANGHEMESPSNSETLILVVGHIISNLAPANFEKLKNMPFKTFKSFAENVVKATDKAKGNEIKIKLIGNKENKARAPYCVSVFKPGEAAVISNDFIGEKLYFSNFELTQMKNMQEAVPTNIGQKIKNLQNSSIEVEDDSDNTSEEETLDFDLL